MNGIDLATGFAIGATVSILFFAGLGLSVRYALRISRPGLVLFCSAAIRITILLLAIWVVAQTGLWSTIGFATAFFLVRLAVVAWVQAPLKQSER